MTKDARVSWFVFWAFAFSMLFSLGLFQAWIVTDARWLMFSFGSLAGAVMLLDRKSKHDELMESVNRVSVQVVPEKSNLSGKYTVKLQIQEDNDNAKFAHLPLPLDELKTIARATLNGRPFSHDSWCGADKLLSRSQFEDLRNWLLKVGYARWLNDSNHNQGLVMTAKGKAFWKAISET